MKGMIGKILHKLKRIVQEHYKQLYAHKVDGKVKWEHSQKDTNYKN